MFRPKPPKPRGIHISPPTPLPCPNPELPLPPTPRPPHPPRDTEADAASDLERDSQTLLEVVEAYERGGPGAGAEDEADVTAFQNFVQGLRREAAAGVRMEEKGERDGLLAEKIMRRVVGGGSRSRSRQRGNVGEGRFHGLCGAGGVRRSGGVDGGLEGWGREQGDGEGKVGGVQNVGDEDEDEDEDEEGASETGDVSSYLMPLSPNPDLKHATRLPRPCPARPSSSLAPTVVSEAPVDWNTIRFSTFARRTVAGFARNGRKRGCDPNDLITDEDMHRKKSDGEMAAEVAAAEAMRDDVEENERRFGLAWEWLNVKSERKEGLGEAVVRSSTRRAREDRGRAEDARGRATVLGELARGM